QRRAVACVHWIPPEGKTWRGKQFAAILHGGHLRNHRRPGAATTNELVRGIPEMSCVTMAAGFEDLAMPLHDWTDRPGWDGVHLLWLTELLRWIKPQLPQGYRAYIGSAPTV